MKINVLIVDDHFVVKEGLKALLKADPAFDRIEEANNGLEAIFKAEKFNPDVIVMDFEMPRYNGVYSAKELIKQNPKVAILILSMHAEKSFILQAIQAGAKGYLVKDSKIEEIREAIKTLYSGGTWFKKEIAEMIASELIANKGRPRNPAKELLTSRESEILRLFAEGKTAEEIGSRLSISKRTVEVDKSNIYKKLNLKNNFDLIRYAIRINIANLS